MGNQSFELSWQPRVEDYREVFAARTQASGARTKLLVVFLIAAIPMVMLFLSAGLAAKVLVVSSYIALGLLMVIITGPAQVLFADRFWKKYPLVQAACRVRINERSIDNRVAGQSDSWRWDLVDEILDADSVFVVQLTVDRQRTFLVLAKRGLSDPDQLPALRAYLSERVPTVRTVRSEAATASEAPDE
ncbi:MAG: hypothetical protein WCI74_11150 [Actinomycetes bacterium]